MKVYDNGAFYTLTINNRDAHDWATRPGARWPCSTLESATDSGCLSLTFDDRTDDLVDATGDWEDIDSEELRAFMDDHWATIANRLRRQRRKGGAV